MCYKASEILDQLAGESRGVCSETETIANKLSDAVAYLEGLADWAHNESVVKFSAGVHKVSGIKKIYAVGRTPQELLNGGNTCLDYKRHGSQLIAGSDMFASVSLLADVDWQGDDEVCWSPQFKSAVFYLAKALMAAKNQKQMEMAFASQLFQTMAASALDVNEDQKWSVKTHTMKGVKQ